MVDGSIKILLRKFLKLQGSMKTQLFLLQPHLWDMEENESLERLPASFPNLPRPVKHQGREGVTQQSPAMSSSDPA